MLFMLFPVCMVVLVGAAVLFVARQLLVSRPAVAEQGTDAPLRADDTPLVVDSVARPTESAPGSAAAQEGPRA